MGKKEKSFKNEREALEAEIAAKLKEIDHAVAELEALRQRDPNSPDGIRRRAVMHIVSTAQSRIERLKADIDRLDKLEAYDLAIQSARAGIKAGRDEIASVAAEVSNLQRKRSTFADKIELLSSSSAARVEHAVAAEKAAAAAYVEAVSIGSEQDQEAAQSEIATAQNELAEARDFARSQAVVIEAVGVQVSAIDASLVSAGERAEEARRRLCIALRYLCESEFDQALDALKRAAERYARSYALMGQRSPRVWSGAIPYFEPCRCGLHFDALEAVELAEVDQEVRAHLDTLFDGRGRLLPALAGSDSRG